MPHLVPWDVERGLVHAHTTLNHSVDQWRGRLARGPLGAGPRGEAAAVAVAVAERVGVGKEAINAFCSGRCVHIFIQIM